MAGCGGEAGPEPEPRTRSASDALAAVGSLHGRGAGRPIPTPDDPRYGGTLVVGNYGELGDGMNSAVTSENTSRQHQQFVNLMTLIDYDESYEPRPVPGRELGARARQQHRSPSASERTCFGTTANGPTLTMSRSPGRRSTTRSPASRTSPTSSSSRRGRGAYEILDDFTIRIHMDPHHPQFMDVFRPLGILAGAPARRRPARPAAAAPLRHPVPGRERSVRVRVTPAAGPLDASPRTRSSPKSSGAGPSSIGTSSG